MFAKNVPLRFLVLVSLACSCGGQASQPGGGNGSGGTGATGNGGAGGTATGTGTAGTGGSGTGNGGTGATGAAGATGTGGASGAGGQTGGAGGAAGTGAGGVTGAGGTTGTGGGGTTAGGGENSGTACTIPAMPAFSALATNTKLPDPFKSMSGSRITTKADWTCRRAEIGAQLQNWELGPKPAKPSQVSGSVTNTAVNVTAGDGTKSISFTASISLPTTGQGPFPAIIGYIGGSLNATAVRNLGVAIINFNNDEIAAQVSASSRGQGKFYDLYGNTHRAGSMMAWAWGVSRIIDVLEQNAATSRVDATHLGVTGCSRDGKGALIAGAFDERIVLTIPQESGSGGTATWRISDSQKAAGMNVQTLSEITGENDWFTASFNQFNTSATKLPFDHHMLLDMVAPRAVLAIDNTGIDWLTAPSSWGAEQAGRAIFQALGVPDNLGASQVSHGDHCTFQASQQPEVDAYIKKFLLGQNVAATVNKTDGPAFVPATWVDWTTPTLN